MRNPLTMALLLAALLLIATGTAWAQADEPEDLPPIEEESDAEPSMEMILKAVSACADQIRLTEADVKQFIDLARDFDGMGNNRELEVGMNRAILSGTSFEKVILANDGFKEWTEKHGVDGSHWLKVFFRIQLLLTREEMAENAAEREMAFEEELEDLEKSREDFGEEFYAEMKKEIEANLAEFHKEVALWRDVTPKPDKEEAALLAKHKREIDVARGRRGDEEASAPGTAEAEIEDEVEDEIEDEMDEEEWPEDEPMEEEPFESEDDIEEHFKKLIAAIADYVRDTRLTEADIQQYVKLTSSFNEVGNNSELDEAIQKAVRDGKPFADLVLADEEYKSWAAKYGVTGDRWLKVFLRVQMVMGREEALEGQEESEQFHKEQLAELEKAREEMGEEAYEQERKWLEESHAEDLAYMEIWKQVAAPTEEETKLLEKFEGEIRKAHGWEEDEVEEED